MREIFCDKSSCSNCTFRKFSFFNELTDEELIMINKNRTTRFIKSGEKIFSENEIATSLISLKVGKAKISKNGIQDAILYFNQSVDFLGLESLIVGTPYPFTATAIENTEICLIPRKDFLELLQTNPDFSMKIIKLLANISKIANDRLLMLTQKHIRGRLAHSLLQLRELHGVLKDKKTLSIQLKRSDLAAYANMNPSNAIRVLSQFVSEKLIETDKRKIKIINLKGLIRISDLG